MSAQRSSSSILGIEPHRSLALREMAVSPWTFSHGVIGNAIMQVFWKEAEAWQKRWFVQSLCERTKLEAVASSYRGASFVFTLLSKHFREEMGSLQNGVVVVPPPISGLSEDFHRLLDCIMECGGVLEQSASGRRLVQKIVQEVMTPLRPLYCKVAFVSLTRKKTKPN
jgi:hypothetical protein